MAHADDSYYIEKVKQGDLQAFATLVDRYKQMAFNVSLKLTRNTQDAEDAVQEAFVKAYQKLDTFNYNSKFSTWLYTIVYRTTVYNLRKNVISTQQIEDNVTKNLTSETLNELEIRDKKEFVAAAINTLPPIESLIITLFYIDEHTIEEIETITDLSRSNIKVKLFRARKKLKIKLKQMLNDEIESLL